MAQQTISAVSAIEPERAAQTSGVAKAETPVRVETPRPEQEQAAQTQAAPAAKPDVQMRFQVNDETKDLTVYIVDRSSQKVIRTIPPDEVNKLQAGDLVQLLA